MSSAKPALETRSPRPYVELYKDGGYLEKNPSWHMEESPFKVKYILEFCSCTKKRGPDCLN
jgi:hypothetical protein